MVWWWYDQWSWVILLRCPYLARNYSYWCLIDWCPRLHALMSAWLLISRLHFTPFVCIFIYMHMFVDFAVLDYFDYGSRDCYFWSFDTFSYFAVRQHCASWDWTITCSILSFRICVVSHRLDIVIAHIVFHMSFVCYPLCCYWCHSFHSWLVQSSHSASVCCLTDCSIHSCLVFIAPEQALACLPQHARKAHSLTHLRPLAHSSAHTPQLHPLCGRLTAHSPLSNPNLHPSS